MPVTAEELETQEHTFSISVIVPTFRDWDRLALCLEGLERQSYPAHLVEVLVVNNDPGSPAPPALVLDANVCILTEECPGSYAARNTGIKAATGEIIALTDSDCVPDRRWIEAAVAELRSGAERVAGRIELFSETSTPSLADEYEMLVGFNQAAYAAKGTSATANMVTWAKHFHVVGLFNPELLSGGDMEWGLRATSRGIGIRYCASCIVRHPTRGSLGELFRKARRVAGGAASARELREGRLWFLRSLLPPRSSALVWRRRDLRCGRRVQLITVAYVLKLWHALHVLLVMARIAPRRRN